MNKNTLEKIKKLSYIKKVEKAFESHKIEAEIHENKVYFQQMEIMKKDANKNFKVNKMKWENYKSYQNNLNKAKDILSQRIQKKRLEKIRKDEEVLEEYKNEKKYKKIIEKINKVLLLKASKKEGKEIDDFQILKYNIEQKNS